LDKGESKYEEEKGVREGVIEATVASEEGRWHGEGICAYFTSTLSRTVCNVHNVQYRYIITPEHYPRKKSIQTNPCLTCSLRLKQWLSCPHSEYVSLFSCWFQFVTVCERSETKDYWEQVFATVSSPLPCLVVIQALSCHVYLIVWSFCSIPTLNSNWRQVLAMDSRRWTPIDVKSWRWTAEDDDVPVFLSLKPYHLSSSLTSLSSPPLDFKLTSVYIIINSND
jgi:hypothetical protein